MRIQQALMLLCFSKAVYGQSDSAQVRGDYFGQSDPGMHAELFGRGIVSTDKYEHSAPAFSPDGKTVIWGIVERDKPSTLLEMRQSNGVWNKPTVVSFGDGLHDDMYPRFSPDGNILYFSSRRPLPRGYPALEDMWIWSVERTASGWNIPRPLDSAVCEGVEYSHSMNTRGDIYFSFRKASGKIFDIGIAKKKKGGYLRSVLPAPINSEATEDGPFVAPDNSFLIFESSRPGGYGSNDLYVCFLRQDGSWGAPKNMGPLINTDHSERFPAVSPDGKYLFFGSDRSGNADLHWISAMVIGSLK